MARPVQGTEPGIFLLTNVPAVYRLELYTALATDARCRFEAAFTALDHPSTAHCQARREDLQFPWHALAPWGWPFGQRPGGPVRGLADHLARFRPAAVVVAGASPAACQALLLARRTGSRRILWWGGTRLSEAGTGRLKNLWRRGVFSLTDGFIAYSEHAADYLMDCGVPGRNILELGNLTFDVDARMARMDAIPREPADAPRMVAVSQLSARKNIRFLLDVHATLRERLPGLELEIIGDGPEREALERHCLDHGIGGVRFPGRLENHHTLQRLRQADVLVHPAALDQWPQVINEGLTAGLPIVASTRSGLSANLVRDGINGWLLELDHAVWVQHLAGLLSNPALLASMGHGSRVILEDYDLGRITARLRDFVLEGVT